MPKRILKKAPGVNLVKKKKKGPVTQINTKKVMKEDAEQVKKDA
jgi:hypothetical protein